VKAHQREPLNEGADALAEAFAAEFNRQRSA
jgi:ribonuclease HI